MILTYPLLREMYFGFWAGSPERYLSERRKDELSRFADELLKNSQSSRLTVNLPGYGGPQADGPMSTAEIESIKRLLRAHHLHLLRMDKQSGCVQYSHCFVRIWLHYIYVADGGPLPPWPECSNSRKVAEGWYFAAE